MGVFLVILAVIAALVIVGYFFLLVSESDHKAGKILRAELARRNVDRKSVV